MQYNDGVDRTGLRSLSGVLLVTAVAAAQISGFVGAFQYDDLFAILMNPHLEGWQTYVQHLGHTVRPVLHATFLFDRSLYGNNPVGYHLVNFLLHVASTLLVCRIVALAITESDHAIPFWTALVFFIHPLTTETVTYISGRASGLMAFWYLLALFLYIKASTGRGHDLVHRVYMTGAVLAYLCSIGSKETAMTFPLVLLLWDIVIRRLNGAALRNTVLSFHSPFWLVLLAAAAWAWHHPRYRELAQFSLHIRPLWDNLLNQAHATIYALLLLVCPWKQNFDHDLPDFHSPFQWPLPLDLFILGGMISASFAGARRFPLIAFGMGWFFIQLLPTSVIPRADLLSERNLYLASVGSMLAIVVFVARVRQWLLTLSPHPHVVRFCANGVSLSVVLALCLVTFQRNAIYRDPILLWSDTVEKSPNKARPHNNLGHAYAMDGEWDRAIEQFRIAAQLDPGYALARKNLHDAYLHVVGRE